MIVSLCMCVFATESDIVNPMVFTTVCHGQAKKIDFEKYKYS